MPTEPIADQNFENIPVVEEKPQKKVLRKPLIIFISAFGGILVILILLAVFFGVWQKQITPPPLPTLTPTPTPEFIQEITTPSLYATDSAILKIEEDLKTIEQQLQTTDLKETGLNPPMLDWEVEFRE